MTSSDEFSAAAALASLFFALLIVLTFLAPEVPTRKTSNHPASPKLLKKGARSPSRTFRRKRIRPV
jgi:hypothetical protein